MKKPLPHISIIIPTYNSGATISVALKSISSQSFKNLEVLIIDGLSVDKTLEIARTYQSTIKNLTIISEEDNGIYDAMNKGIKLAKGEWLYFMGSDDSLYSPETLKKIFSLPEIENYDIIYGNVLSPRFDGLYDGEFTYSKLAIKNICHQSIFFRKTVFKKTGYFDLKFKALADWDHNIKWFYSSKISRLYVDSIIANYSDGGFSSLIIDEKFNEVKDLKLIKNGYGKIPGGLLRDICENAILQSKRTNSYFLFNFLKILKLGLKLEKFFKHKLNNSIAKF